LMLLSLWSGEMVCLFIDINWFDFLCNFISIEIRERLCVKGFLQNEKTIMMNRCVNWKERLEYESKVFLMVSPVLFFFFFYNLSTCLSSAVPLLLI
jgi:hypothetical protein